MIPLRSAQVVVLIPLRSAQVVVLEPRPAPASGSEPCEVYVLRPPVPRSLDHLPETIPTQWLHTLEPIVE